MNRMGFNIAHKVRYKPFGPHTFCWRKTTYLEFQICCRSEAEASVALRLSSGRKPAGRCKNLLCISHRSTVPVSSNGHRSPRWLRPTAEPQGLKRVNHKMLENHERRIQLSQRLQGTKEDGLSSAVFLRNAFLSA